MQQLIGNIALNISFLVYLVLYVPQVIHNRRRKSTEGLSFLMHVLLMIGYAADIMYGYGRHMPLQYCLVSTLGLICLSVQHIQFGYYQKVTLGYVVATGLILAWLGYVLFAVISASLPAHDYINAGFVAWATGVVYTLPQVWKNYRFASVLGVSLLFVFFDIVSSFCDSVAAWCLHWDLPSRLGSPTECVLGLVLLVQIYYFSRRPSSINQSVAKFS